MVIHVMFLQNSTFGGGRYGCLIVSAAELYQPCLLEMSVRFNIKSAHCATEADFSNFSIITELQQFGHLQAHSKN